MYKFGTRPPRSVESFGVAGLLGEECRVFYDSLYSTRHLGRVSDLLAARLRKAQPDELKLRALLLYTIFEAYLAHAKGSSEETFPEPLVVECGIDAEKVAIGASFTLAEGVQLETEGLAERVTGGSPDGSFETLIANLLSHANRVVVRTQPGIRRLEVVGVIGIAGKMEAEALAEPAALEVVVFNAAPSETPKAASYVELGDLDYPRLLREDSPGQHLAPPPTGEILVKAVDAELLKQTTVGGKESSELADAIRMRGAANEGEPETGFTGDETADLATRIGADRKAPQLAEVLRFSGERADLMDQTLMRIKSSGPQAIPTQDLSGAQSQIFVEMIDQLQKKIELLETDRVRARQVAAKAEEELAVARSQGPQVSTRTVVIEGERPEATQVTVVKSRGAEAGEEVENEDETEIEAADAEEEGEEAVASAKAKKKKRFGGIWPFGKAAPAGAEEEEESEGKEDAEGPAAEAKTPAAKSVARTDAESEADAATSSIISEIQSGVLDRTLAKAQKEAAEIKKEVDDGRTKRWVDGLMGELAAEKSRIADLAKKLTQSIRAKELEYRNKEQTLQEELRRRDDMLKQKNSALSRVKDQLAQTTLAIERLKAAGGGGGEDGHIKQRYAHVQKLLTATKEENAMLSQKVEELRGQLSSANFSPKTRGPSFTDFQQLQSRYERVQRQAEELKKTNQQILDRLNEQKKERGSSTANVEEMKKRLEAAMKLVTMNKKDAEKKDLRIAELQQEELKLKSDLARAQGELKTLRMMQAAGRLAKGSGGGGTKPGGSEAA
jgi:hypothetical protein